MKFMARERKLCAKVKDGVVFGWPFAWAVYDSFITALEFGRSNKSGQ